MDCRLGVRLRASVLAQFMDLLGRMANTANVVCSLLLSQGYIAPWLSILLLIGFNGANAAVAAFSLFAGLCLMHCCSDAVGTIT